MTEGALSETARALTCPNCGGTIALRAAGVSVTLVCEHCGSALDATREDVRVITAAATAMRRSPIPLGTRGTIDEVQWEVVGYLERADAWVQWCEYLLFNPYEGYAFLVFDNRRYSLARLIDRAPGGTWQGLTLGDAVYGRFGDRYDVHVTFVVGEFYWRIKVGETVTACDHVRPGFMLSLEEDGSERTWSLSKMLAKGVATKAFGAPREPMTWGGTPSPHEPSPYGRLVGEAMIIAFAAVLALFAIAFSGGRAQRLEVATLEAPIEAGSRSVVLGPITLTGQYNRVTIEAEAHSLDNAWVDLDYSLVDRRTQESFDSYSTAEYYTGRDSEGSWSEGDWRPSVSLSSIPAGSYDLVVEAAAQRWTGSVTPTVWPLSETTAQASYTVPVQITISAGGTFFSNIFLALLPLLPWPIILILLHFDFEKRRKAPLTED
jgi:hypothetical protein